MVSTKKPRPRWSLLLALLLGVGTWWGIGWWLAPQAYWEAWYQPIDGKRIGRAARILDRDDRYLYVQTDELTNHQFEIIDLHTRKRVACHAISNPVLRDRYVPGGYPSDPQGILPVVKYHYGTTGGQIDYNKYEGCDFWLWNLLTNDSHLIKSYPRTTYPCLCQDGTVMLELERVIPLLPSSLSIDLATLLGSLATKAVHCPDWEVIRIWSVPQMTLRCIFVEPCLHRYPHAQLTGDGSCLVFLDSVMDEGFVSKEMALEQNGEKRMLALPKGIKVFDTHTGLLRAERTGYEGGYLGFDSTYPRLLIFRQPLNNQRDCMLNLLNNQWLEATNAAWPVLHPDHYSVPQLCCVSNGQGIANLLPAGIVQMLNPRGGLYTWLHQERWLDIQLFHNRAKSHLLTLHTQLASDFRASLTNRWLVTTCYEGDTYHVAVHSYPLDVPWSPWWGRGAGMVVTVLCWLAFTRSKRSQS